MYEKPTAPASIGGVLDDGLRLWRNSLNRTWGLALLAQAIAAIPAIFFAPPAVVPAANASLNERLMLIMGQSSRYMFSFLVFLALSYIFRNAVIARVNSIAVNSELSFGQSLSKGLRLTPRTLGMGLLVGVAFFLFFVVLAFIGGVAVAMSGKTSVLIRLVLGIGGLLAAIFAIYASIKFIVAYPAIFVDDLSATESLRASWNMTRGYWWRIAAILGTITIIAIVLAIVLAIVGAIVGATLKTTTTGGIVAIQLTAIVVYSFLGSLSPAMLIALYGDLKLRTEGGDLVGRVSALASR